MRRCCLLLVWLAAALSTSAHSQVPIDIGISSSSRQAISSSRPSLSASSSAASSQRSSQASSAASSSASSAASSSLATAPGKEWWVLTAVTLPIDVQPGRTLRITLGQNIRDTEATTSCRFLTANEAGRTVRVISNARGQAVPTFIGWLAPSPNRELREGRCKFNLRVVTEGRGPSLAFNRVSPLITVAPHLRVLVTETERLRDWLKPESNCLRENLRGKLSFGLRAGPVPVYCQTKMMTSTGRFTGTDPRQLAEGVILSSISWKMEGPRPVCGLCAHAIQDCTHPLPPPPTYFPEVFNGPLVEEGNATGTEYSVFTGPPGTQRNAPVLSPNGSPFATGSGRWNSWMLPITGGLSCAPWAPSPSDVGSVARDIGNAIGDLTSGRQPAATPPPEAPVMHLMLDHMEFWRPGSQRLPFE